MFSLCLSIDLLYRVPNLDGEGVSIPVYFFTEQDYCWILRGMLCLEHILGLSLFIDTDKFPHGFCKKVIKLIKILKSKISVKRRELFAIGSSS